ncbi:MAG TPA: hypothetical protein PLI58_05355 [Candidatus Syntrophosphaera sp.]|jgi:hypothetical protein|nr:hypothetical protein [Candidatus Cloacimonadota bacterium]OQB92548.1 MAG: hypothetical protein BWX83_00069 [Candidatus Cloacimonetes bacterium ADurb.Bin117]HNU54801.1 hypothetical protein [Candidatus Syntrophosphaera sp.]HOH48495.1 hypothetical protein [Candidatus Syntrophosphaera sp.]HPB43509.1 hypothetical protein [Candidatus Syntrophosphaera sp.]
MRAKFVILILIAVVAVFANFWNANQMVRATQKLARMETKLAAEKNINTELRVESDDLRSGRQFAELMSADASGQPVQAGKIIYVHEPADKQSRESYCIIDLFASKAQAKEVQILLD